MNQFLRILAAVPLVTAGAWASAQAPLPQPETQDGTTYLNGGVGESEVQYLKSSMKDYSLALVFSRPGGEYLANVAVTIKDAKGRTVFDVASAGPYLLVKLPPGRYAVVAASQGDAKTRSVSVGTSAKSLTGFTWP